MALINAYGFLGVALTAGLSVLFHYALKIAFHFTDDGCMVYDFQFAALVMGLFGLTVDRCEERTLWRGYALNFTNASMGAFNQAVDRNGLLYRPDRRLSIFAVPLALAPIFMEAGILVFWPMASVVTDGKQDNHAFIAGLITGIPILVVWYYYSVRTHTKRDLPELEIVLSGSE